MKSFLLSCTCFVFFCFSGNAQSHTIRINQLGYHPMAIKQFVVASPHTAVDFKVVHDGVPIYEGVLGDVQEWNLAGEKVRLGEFTAVEAEGTYTIEIEGLEASHPFKISPRVYDEVLPASVRAYYYLRSGTALKEEHAGKWHRNGGHSDLKVSYHRSLQRKGTIDAPRGWYDAGDYGKYTVNGAFTAGQLLMMHERFPEVLGDGSLGIPESGNGISDLLDEVKYETDWLLTMQDDDGGVFHKLTCDRFVGMVLPEEAQCERFVMAKGTGGSLDFAAVMAKVYRAYHTIDSAYAEQCLTAAKKAWAWAKTHPNVAFKNPKGVITGEYGDTDFSEEWFWAASELYKATEEMEYLEYIKKQDITFEYSYGDGWRKFMKYLGIFSLLSDDSQIPESLREQLKNGIVSLADVLLDKSKTLDYQQAVDSYQWGSNSDIQNTAVIMAEAYRLQPKEAYIFGVQSALDYLLGKNAVGYSFLTGFGSKSPMHIHHRPSAGDGIEAPVPGYVVGGPNFDRQDRNQVTYPEGVAPMQAWKDVMPSFASNEICINWNSPLPFLIAFYTSSLEQR